MRINSYLWGTSLHSFILVSTSQAEADTLASRLFSFVLVADFLSILSDIEKVRLRLSLSLPI